MKTKIYNLIILDESGSMSFVQKETIAGCNNTIKTICRAQGKYKDSQEHYVSVYAFQSDGDMPSRYLLKNQPIAEAKPIGARDYNPEGCTPLYDALGSTLSDLRHKVEKEKQAIGSVTVITDGYENSSEFYDQEKVARMISALKEKGWNFNFIGANIDVETVASELNIENSLSFSQTREGVGQMFDNEQHSRMGYFSRVHANSMAEEDGAFEERMKRASKDYFKK